MSAVLNIFSIFLDYLDNIAKADDMLILLHIFNPPPPPAMSSKGKEYIYYTGYPKKMSQSYLVCE